MSTTQREFPGFETFSELNEEAAKHMAAAIRAYFAGDKEAATYEEAAKHMAAAIRAYFSGNKEAATNELVDYAAATLTARKLENAK